MILHIVRHAKAEDESPTGQDADRPLRKRGHRQAEALGRFFAAEQPRPQLVLASPYQRARETAEHIWAALDILPQLDDRLAARTRIFAPDGIGLIVVRPCAASSESDVVCPLTTISPSMP